METMSNTNRVEDDLRYVRSVLDQAEKGKWPAGIYYLWAVVSFAGMSVIDFRPDLAGPYWAVAGPLGGVASGYLGWRAGRSLGQDSRREGTLNSLHWMGMMVAILLLVPLPAMGAISERVLPSLILLIVALGYYTAGIYLERALLFVGMIMAGCYVATILVENWPWIWTFTGTVLAASLIVSAQIGKAAWRRRASGDGP